MNYTKMYIYIDLHVLYHCDVHISNLLKSNLLSITNRFLAPSKSQTDTTTTFEAKKKAKTARGISKIIIALKNNLRILLWYISLYCTCPVDICDILILNCVKIKSYLSTFLVLIIALARLPIWNIFSELLRSIVSGHHLKILHRVKIMQILESSQLLSMNLWIGLITRQSRKDQYWQVRNHKQIRRK